MQLAAFPARSQFRWRSSASQPTRMARAKVSRSEIYFATASPVETAPHHLCPILRRKPKGGSRRRRRENGFRATSAAAERAGAIPHGAEKGRRRTAAAMSRVLRRQATATQRRSRASGGGVRRRHGKRFPPCFRRRQVQRSSRDAACCVSCEPPDSKPGLLRNIGCARTRRAAAVRRSTGSEATPRSSNRAGAPVERSGQVPPPCFAPVFGAARFDRDDGQTPYDRGCRQSFRVPPWQPGQLT